MTRDIDWNRRGVLTVLAATAATGCAGEREARMARMQRVRFDSDGAAVVGDLFLPSGAVRAAVVFLGPMTSVKEQSAGVYARALAERGYAALAFDPRHFGESGGEPRQLENPEAKIRDVINAVTALGGWEATRDLPVLALGLCIGGGYMAEAVARDPRIRAFASVVGAFVEPALIREAMGDAYDLSLQRGQAAEAMWRETGSAETIPAVGPDGGDVGMPSPEAYAYYGTERAGPTYVNGYAVQSQLHVLPFDAMAAAARITVPFTMVHSETAVFPDQARRFHAAVTGEKRQTWLTSEGQVDFYDDPRLVNASVAAAVAGFEAALA